MREMSFCERGSGWAIHAYLLLTFLSQEPCVTPVNSFAPKLSIKRLSVVHQHQNWFGTRHNGNVLQPLQSATLDVSTPSSPTSMIDENTERQRGKSQPLQQHWWPVALMATLDKEAPNAIRIFDKKLVLWHDGDNWSCMDDVCSHRFAPLSEGRVIPKEGGKEDAADGTEKKCLQCAYHGWEFNGKGSCLRIPQSSTQRPPQSSTSSSSKNSKKKPLGTVTSYPLRHGANMIWIWPDTSTSPPPNQDLPISPLLQRVTALNPKLGFQRDLPYGYELLGENLLDLSHLPFSHHGVGNLNRTDGGPVPFTSLSESQRRTVWEDEQTQQHYPGVTTPATTPFPALFQAQVPNATLYDPIFKGQAAQGGMHVAEADCFCGFYEPAHVRYRRVSTPMQPGGKKQVTSNTELFMCPTTAGKSRVFLFPAMDAFLPPIPSSKEDSSSHGMEKAESPPPPPPSPPPPKAAPKRPSNFGAPMEIYKAHLLTHLIFDGDGIFLHKQADRMASFRLSYKQYYTPTPADVLVNGFRRWLDGCAQASMEADEEEGKKVAFVATGGLIGGTEGEQASVYGGDGIPRSKMLDRYESHTAQCPLCREALQKLEHKRDQRQLAMTGLVGAVGACGASSLLGTVWSLVTILGGGSGGALKRALPALKFATVSLMGLGGSVWAGRKIWKQKRGLEEQIREFYFVDYVHQEKH